MSSPEIWATNIPMTAASVRLFVAGHRQIFQVRVGVHFLERKRTAHRSAQLLFQNNLRLHQERRTADRANDNNCFEHGDLRTDRTPVDCYFLEMKSGHNIIVLMETISHLYSHARPQPRSAQGLR